MKKSIEKRLEEIERIVGKDEENKVCLEVLDSSNKLVFAFVQESGKLRVYNRKEEDEYRKKYHEKYNIP